MGVKMKKKLSDWKETLVAYGFLSPWFIGFIFFTGGPIIASFVLSLTRWNLFGSPEFIGFANYRSLFSEGSQFFSSLRVTFIYTIISVTVSVISSLFLAVLLNFKLKFMGIFRFFYFVPAVMPSVAMAAIFRLMLNQEMGIINHFLSTLGVTASPNWLNDLFWIWPTLAIVSIFTYSTGQMMMIFNSALREVPQHLYEACDLEGANFFQRFRHVTLPSISPIILFNTVVATVNSFNTSFSVIYPLTGGGPGSETTVLSLSIYEYAFRLFDMGYASALAVILFIIVACVAAIQFRVSKKSVTYD
jgi:multiple sugar transport system permease protein